MNMITLNIVVRYVLFLYMLRLINNTIIIGNVYCTEYNDEESSSLPLYDTDYDDTDNYDNVNNEYDKKENDNNNNILIDLYEKVTYYLSIVNEEFDNAEIILSQFDTYETNEQVEVEDDNYDSKSNNNNYEEYYVKLKELDYMNQYQNHIDKTINAYQNVINTYQQLYSKVSNDLLQLQLLRQEQQQQQNYVIDDDINNNIILDEEIDIINSELWIINYHLANTYYSLASIYYLLLTSPLVQSLHSSYYYTTTTTTSKTTISTVVVEKQQQQYLYNSKKMNEKLAINYYKKSYSVVEILLAQVQEDNNNKDTTSTTTTNQEDNTKGENPIPNKVVVNSITQIEAEVLLAYCSMRIGNILLYNQPLLLTTTDSTTTSSSSLSLSKHITLDGQKQQQDQYQYYQTIVNNNLMKIIEQTSITELLSYISDPTKFETIINDSLNTILVTLEEEHKQQEEHRKRKTSKQQQQQQQQQSTTGNSENDNRQERIIQSKIYINNAERLFRKLLDNEEEGVDVDVDADDNDDNNYNNNETDSNNNKLYLQRHLASVLCYAAEISNNNENDSMSALFYYDECIELNIATIDYEKEQQQKQLLLLQQEPEQVQQQQQQQQQQNNIYSSFDTFYGNDHDGTIINCHLSIVDSLYTVSDVALRQGEYDIAKDRYHRAMEWIEEYDVPVQSLYDQVDTEFAASVDDKQLNDLLQKLEEYTRNFGRTSSNAGNTGSNTMDPMSDHGHHFFEEEPSTDEYILDENGNIIVSQKDDGYEGDLHSSLGSMYMYKHDYVVSLSYFQQAIRLYEHAGDYSSIAMANTKYSLSTLYFRIGEYSTSATEYIDALDIFQQIYGNNIDPFSISAQWKTIINNLDTSIYDPLSIGALLTGVTAFSTGINGGANIATATTASTTSIDSESDDPIVTTATISNSNKQQITDEKNADVTELNKSKDSAIKTILDDSPTIHHERNNDHSKTSNKNNVVLPSGSTIDIGRFLQQNKSLHDEL